MMLLCALDSVRNNFFYNFYNPRWCHGHYLEKSDKIAISQNILTNFDEICYADSYWPSGHYRTNNLRHTNARWQTTSILKILRLLLKI